MGALSVAEAAERKAREVEELVGLINSHRVLGVASLYKVRAIQLQGLRKKLRPEIRMRVAKNNLFKMAIGRSEKPEVDKLSTHLSGSNIFLFTNMNPFKLSILLDKNRVKMTAKAGDVAQNDIVVYAGNTGLPPGPIISELHQVGIRTRIESGSVWVVRDTVVAKRGETIPPELASILSRLGMKPLEIGLSMIAAYDDGSILTGDQLRVDLDGVRRQLEEASLDAFNLALNASYPTPKTIVPILQRAVLQARGLAIGSAYPSPEVVADMIRIGYTHMASLAARLAQVNKDAAPSDLSTD
ncbi:MAG: 50S ribosomal protein L10 [Candidatus Bathyarchaeia archaeon]